MCVLRYPDFCTNSRAQCEEALACLWNEHGQYRYNEGVARRGRKYFPPDQLSRLSHLLSYYPDVSPWRTTHIAKSVPH